MQIPSSIFKAYDIRGKVGTELTGEAAERIGRALAQWLPTKGVVAVGRDMRPDSKMLADRFIEGLRSEGRDVWDIGEVTSDMIYFAVGKYELAGGAVITASHNAGDYNGIKIYRDKVTPVGLDTGLDQIRDMANSEMNEPSAKKGGYEQKNIVEAWVDHCLSIVSPVTWPKFQVAIDAGNGMAGAILPHILSKLPIKATEMYFELDGTFPNHEANPQNHDTLKNLIDTIKQNNLDFGIAFDGDGDRAAFVDDKSRPVLGTDLISIVASYILKLHPGSKIVHDVRTSRATTELIKEWGGEPVRTKAGRVYIGKLVRELGATFGGETTGHLFFAENFDADSGMIAALVVMQALAETDKKLSELVDEYRRYELPHEINFTVSDIHEVFDRLRDMFKDAQQDELDGLTIELEDGWFNLRASNTEPVVRLNIEATDKNTLEQLLAKVRQAIESE